MHRHEPSNHAFANFHPRVREGLCVSNRRGMLKAGLAGMAGLNLPTLLQAREQAIQQGESLGKKSVILLWMAGGPSQIDTWDPKPERPVENRGPFQSIDSAIPGVSISEHLPKQAVLLDRFTIIRSVDCRNSDHSPGKVMQTGNREASPRKNPQGDLYPAMGSVVAKFHGPNQPGMPPYVAFNRDPNHIPGGGHIGMRYDSMNGHRAAGLPDYQGFGRLTARDAETSQAVRFTLPESVSIQWLQERRSLLQSFDQLRSEIDRSGAMDALDHFQQQAVEMVLGGRAQAAFDLSRVPQKEQARYGKQLWCQQALLARRLIEAGTAFVTIDLSMGINAGDWDSHGDQHVFGGISTGLKPLLPIFDHLITTLVEDLEERGMLDDVLILAMGEFGRSPVIGTQKGFSGGRNHWPRVMSMCVAGGGLNHGRVIGSSNTEGGEIRNHPVNPGDLAATIYTHMGVPLDSTYTDAAGRPRFIVEGDGRSIAEIG